VFFAVFFVSCSNDTSNLEKCPITIDTVSIVDSKIVDNISYYLVHRISGWSDKTEILELYNEKPIFDHCSNSNIAPVFGDSLALSMKVSHIYLDVNNNSLEIEYDEGQVSDSETTSFKLELKK
jgi:hypothetical protein